jgi:GT2 family glycosyltransferase
VNLWEHDATIFVASHRECPEDGRIINFFYLPTDTQENCFKRILKFTLKQLLHVSVQSPSSASVLFELAKVIVVKIGRFRPFIDHEGP